MKFDVWNESTGKWMETDEEWMEGVNLEGAKEFTYSSCKNGSLIVDYSNGEKVAYENCHGTWGFPTSIK